MATTKLVALLLLSLLAFSILASEVSAGQSHTGSTRTRYGSGSVPQYKCGSECSRRCGNTRYHKPCIFFCNKCCRKCLCVPPGTYGNKQVCPCYNNWKTQQGGPKCP